MPCSQGMGATAPLQRAGCARVPIECAHVRRGTNGGAGLKPSDQWVISLCRFHHAEQHRLGERAFEKKYGVDLVKLASTFTRLSPHRERLRELGARERSLTKTATPRLSAPD